MTAHDRRASGHGPPGTEQPGRPIPLGVALTWGVAIQMSSGRGRHANRTTFAVPCRRWASTGGPSSDLRIRHRANTYPLTGYPRTASDVLYIGIGRLVSIK